MNTTDERLEPTSDLTIYFCCQLLAQMALDGAKSFTIRDYPDRELTAALFEDDENKVIQIPRRKLPGIKGWFELVSQNLNEGKYFVDVDALLLNGPSIQLIAQKSSFELGKDDNGLIVRVTIPQVD